MLMIMGGFPLSGKTEFVKQFINSIPSKDQTIMHINPQNALPEDYDSFDQATKQIWNISAWELGCEKAIETIQRTNNNDIVIFDTAASKSNALMPLIEEARQHNHHVLYVFVHSTTEDRKVRAKNQSLLGLWESNYANEFKTTIPALNKIADKSWVVKNIGNNLDGINKSVTRVIKFIEGINGKAD